MAIKQGWTGRVFEDFEVGDIYEHPLGRTVIAAVGPTRLRATRPRPRRRGRPVRRTRRPIRRAVARRKRLSVRTIDTFAPVTVPAPP